MRVGRPNHRRPQARCNVPRSRSVDGEYANVSRSLLALRGIAELDLDGASLAAVHANELTGANDIECDGDPRCDTGQKNPACRVQRAPALNEEAPAARRTPKEEGKDERDRLTDDDHGTRHDRKPRPTKGEL